MTTEGQSFIVKWTRYLAAEFVTARKENVTGTSSF